MTIQLDTIRRSLHTARGGVILIEYELMGQRCRSETMMRKMREFVDFTNNELGSPAFGRGSLLPAMAGSVQRRSIGMSRMRREDQESELCSTVREKDRPAGHY